MAIHRAAPVPAMVATAMRPSLVEGSSRPARQLWLMAPASYSTSADGVETKVLPLNNATSVKADGAPRDLTVERVRGVPPSAGLEPGAVIGD